MTEDYLPWHDYPEEKEEDIHICEREDCSHKGMKCELDYYNEETKQWEEQIEWLCPEHAEEAGYCMGCGTFIAGTGMEYRNNGYCDNCWDEIRSTEMEEEEDENEYYDDNFP